MLQESWGSQLLFPACNTNLSPAWLSQLALLQGPELWVLKAKMGLKGYVLLSPLWT